MDEQIAVSFYKNVIKTHQSRRLQSNTKKPHTVSSARNTRKSSVRRRVLTYRLKKSMFDMLGGRCYMCNNPDWRVQDFNHLDGVIKVAPLSFFFRLISDRLTNPAEACRLYNAMVREACKCCPLCANCHRLHTFYDFPLPPKETWPERKDPRAYICILS